MAAPTTTTTPVQVGAVRGLLWTLAIVVLGAVAAVLEQETGIEWGHLAPFVPVLPLVLRTLEAYALDQRRGQAQQAGVLGGAPADPVAYIGRHDVVAAMKAAGWTDQQVGAAMDARSATPPV